VTVWTDTDLPEILLEKSITFHKIQHSNELPFFSKCFLAQERNFSAEVCTKWTPFVLKFELRDSYNVQRNITYKCHKALTTYDCGIPAILHTSDFVTEIEDDVWI